MYGRLAGMGAGIGADCRIRAVVFSSRAPLEISYFCFYFEILASWLAFLDTVRTERFDEILQLAVSFQ